MGDSLIMHYGKVSDAGQAAGDISTNLAVTLDTTAPGCVGAARAFPNFQTSQALLWVHGQHTEVFNTHIANLRTTADGIQGSVVVTAAADSQSSSDAAGVVTGEL
jgi:hypothetical protein